MKNILIERNEVFLQIVILEDNELLDYYLEATDELSIVGNIYIGKVVNIVNSLSGAFVDIGLRKNAFLDFKNFIKSSINPFDIKLGEELIVQVIKDPISEKGAVITTKLNLSSENFVLVVDENQVRISSKIKGKEIRNSLTELVKANKDDSYGVVIRTSAESANNEVMIEELIELRDIYKNILQSKSYINKNKLLFQSDSSIIEFLRFHIQNDTVIRVNKEIDFNTIKKLLKSFDMMDVDLKNTNDDLLLFNSGVSKKIDLLLSKHVKVKDGATLVIDKTEAMTVIDVNSSKHADRFKGEETKLDINILAAREAIRQIKLRNLSGIILIDFIDMRSNKSYKKLLRSIDEFLTEQCLKLEIHGFTNLGLLEITRKREHRNILEIMTSGHEDTLMSYNLLKYKLLSEISRLKEHRNQEAIAFEITEKYYEDIIDDDLFRNQDIEIYFKMGETKGFKIIRTGKKEYVENSIDY